MDLRVEKTYKSLRETFIQLMEKKNFDDITVNELCDCAMIRRATFYQHFHDKYDYFAFFIQQIKEECFPSPSSHFKNEDISSYYLSFFEKLVSFANEYSGVVNSVKNSSAFPTLLDILSEEIYHDIKLHLENDDSSSLPDKTHDHSFDSIATFLSGGIIYLLRFWLMNKETLSLEELFNDFKIIINKIMI